MHSIDISLILVLGPKIHYKRVKQMINQTVSDEILLFILSSVNQKQLEQDVDIFETGLVSSLFAIELMAFLEHQYTIKVTLEDLDMDNFKSVNNIVEFVTRKRKEG